MRWGKLLSKIRRWSKEEKKAKSFVQIFSTLKEEVCAECSLEGYGNFSLWDAHIAKSKKWLWANFNPFSLASWVLHQFLLAPSHPLTPITSNFKPYLAGYSHFHTKHLSSMPQDPPRFQASSHLLVHIIMWGALLDSEV